MKEIKTKPKVSVIIPVYNEECYLRKCLDSVLQQTIDSIEVICIDDGSTDQSMAILNEYAGKNHNFKVLRQQNQGAGTARNRGIQIAQGEFVSFMDSDDMYPDCYVLEKLYELAISHEVKVCGGSMQYLKEDGFPVPFYLDENNRKQVFQTDGVQNYFDYQFEYGYYRFIYRLDLLRENNICFPLYRRFQDPPFMVRAMIAAKEFYAVKEPTYAYRKGHREVVWTEEKVVGLMDGILDLLHVALENNLMMLANSALRRTCIDFSKEIQQELRKGSNEARKRQVEMLEICRNTEGLKHYESGIARLCSDEMFDLINNRRNAHQKESNIKVSIIMPSLNVKPYIRECIESALNQTMKEIEIICIDAGSTDGTLEILQEYAEKDSRIQIIHSPVKSYGYQMNLGLDVARGEFLAILETDDWIKPLMCEELYQLAQDNYLDFIKSDRSSFVGDGDNREFTYLAAFGPMYLRKYYWKVMNPQEEPEIFFSHNLTQTGLYRLSFIRENKIRYHETPGASYQDNGFFFLTMCHAHRVMIIEKDYYMLRRDNPFSSVKSVEKVYCICDEYDFIRERLAQEPELEKKFAPLCAYIRFKNYEWTYGRIDDKYKQEFLIRFASDYEKLMEAGEIDGSYYNMEESFRLRMLLDCPQAYKYHREITENIEKHHRYISKAERKIDPAGNIDEHSRADQLQYDLDCVHKSVSFRIGRAITFLPRFFRKMIKNSLLLAPITPPKPAENKIIDVRRDYLCYSDMKCSHFFLEVCRWYETEINMPLNLNDTKLFNEKMQWMKLYDSTTLKMNATDKYLRREYVAEKIGSDNLPPILGVWSKSSDIDLSNLPDKFVLKLNHGKGLTIVVTDKSEENWHKVCSRLDEWLAVNYAFVNGLELHRMNIVRKIIAEPYLPYRDEMPIEYQMICFNGKVKRTAAIITDSQRNITQSLYDENWNQMNHSMFYPMAKQCVEKPELLSVMKTLAEKLAEPFAFVCVSFFCVDDRVFFETMEFMPQGGIIDWDQVQLNRSYGDMLRLPIKSPIPKNRS